MQILPIGWAIFAHVETRMAGNLEERMEAESKELAWLRAVLETTMKEYVDFLDRMVCVSAEKERQGTADVRAAWIANAHSIFEDCMKPQQDDIKLTHLLHRSS